MKLNIFSTIAIASIALSGCHKMYFHNGAQTNAPFQKKGLTHEFVYELIELAPPKNLKMMCMDKDWSTVEVERTFLNGLISGIQPVYGQWTVQVACK